MLSTTLVSRSSTVTDMAEDTVKLQLRLPKDLHAALNAQAKRDVRSLHGQIIAILKAATENERQESQQRA